MRLCRRKETAPPIFLAVSNTTAGPSTRRKSEALRVAAMCAEYLEAYMQSTLFDAYKAKINLEESADLQRAEEALSELLKKITDPELRDAIDRAAGRVGYLREAEGFEAGCRLIG